MVADLVFFGDGVALAFGGRHMHQHWPGVLVGFFEGSDQFLKVVAIHRPHVEEAQFLKHRPHLGHGEALHTFLNAIQFRRERVAQERQVLELLFEVVSEELHRGLIRILLR